MLGYSSLLKKTPKKSWLSLERRTDRVSKRSFVFFFRNWKEKFKKISNTATWSWFWKHKFHFSFFAEIQNTKSLRKYMGFRWKTKRKNQCRFAVVTSYNWRKARVMKPSWTGRSNPMDAVGNQENLHFFLCSWLQHKPDLCI